MNRSRFVCEQCGSANVRRSQEQSRLDILRMPLGQYPLRCLDCQHRFWVNIFLFSKLRFARCPQCLNFTLTTWDPKQYHIPRWRKLLLRLGAHRYRCKICRVNFISFRATETLP